MQPLQKPRSFEYSSLVMGSRDVPTVSYFPFQKKPSINSTKTFIRKNDMIHNKYAKSRPPKIRTKNERPDIFLEGEHIARTNTAWQQEIDFRYFENMRYKMRKSTSNALNKHQPAQVTVVKTVVGPSSTPTWADSEEESPMTRDTNGRRTANTLIKHSRNHPKTYSTCREPTPTQSPTRTRNNLEIKIMQKAQLKLQQSVKAAENFKRKQLFYMSQKDMTSIRSQSFIVVEYPSAQIITGYYYKKTVQIASLTKIMTFYTVAKILQSYELNPEKITVRIDEVAADISGTSADLVEGDTYTVLQLLYGLMLPSGNDAAVALARWGGSILQGDSKDFIGLMNRYAIQLGMKSSSFGNPHGLPHPQNGSTAEDISLLISKCLDFELFRIVIKCKVYRCWTQNSGIKREVVWQNTNKLLRRPGFEGVKTGVTVTAGPCLASLYTVRNRTFIVVLLRTSKLSRRFKQTRWILSMCLRRLNFDGSFGQAVRQLSRQDAQLDSDNSEDEQQFNFDRNDLFELDRRRKIIINDL